jgi:predicted RecA/RadA family phage recombinase
MQNFRQVGEQLTITAPADVVSGQGLKIGAMFGVCTHTAKAGTELVIRLKGVVNLPKASGAVTECQKVYWDDTAKAVTTTATGNSVIGVGRPAVTGATTVDVVLDGTSI